MKRLEFVTTMAAGSVTIAVAALKMLAAVEQYRKDRRPFGFH